MDNELTIKIDKIAKTIMSNSFSTNELGLLGGNSGIILFLFYYSKVSKSEKAYNYALDILEQTIASINSQSAFYYAFGNGITGFLWTINYLIKNDFVDLEHKQFIVFDSFLFQSMDEQSRDGNYDYLHGALGVGLYFSTRNKTDNLKNFLSKLVVNLNKTRLVYGNRKIAWEYFLRSKRKKVLNIGMSHGLAGVIAVLSGFINKRIIRGVIIEELIIQSMNYLLTTKRDYEKNSLFPNYINLDRNYNNTQEEQSSRLAWCYGDLGISVAIWHASQALGRKDWEQEAISTILHSAKRRDIKQNGVVDAGLCHGTAGIAHIFNRMYGYTGIEALKEASEYWFEQTLKMARFEDGLAGYKAWHGNERGWVNEPGLLEGIAGIGLALISAVSDIEPAWDECLLLS